MTFDKAAYRKKRSNIDLVELKKAVGYEIVGYRLASVKESGKFKDDVTYDTLSGAQKALGKSKKYEIKARIKKPLSGQQKIKPLVIPNIENGANVSVGFDSDGHMIVKDRAFRRRNALKLRTKNYKVTPRKLAKHRKKQAQNKRRELREERLRNV